MAHREITPDDVHDAILDNEMFLQYLPVMRIEDGACVGAEALVRWRRDGEVVPPLAFVPMVERSPVGGTLTYWVMDRVGEELLDWLLSTPAAHIAINVPPLVLGRGALRYVAGKCGLVDLGDRLVYEITERGAVDDLGLDELARIERRGAKIGLDDVGIPHSNVLTLAHLPVDIIKLDRDMIDRIDGQDRVKEAETLAALTAAADQIVIAEGVERESQVDVLRQTGIHLAQGWYYSGPLPVDDFTDFFAAHAPAD